MKLQHKLFRMAHHCSEEKKSQWIPLCACQCLSTRKGLHQDKKCPVMKGISKPTSWLCLLQTRKSYSPQVQKRLFMLSSISWDLYFKRSFKKNLSSFGFSMPMHTKKKTTHCLVVYGGTHWKLTQFQYNTASLISSSSLSGNFCLQTVSFNKTNFKCL